MKSIVAFFLDRKMFIDILLFSIFLLGLISVATSRKEGFPEVRLNKFVITTIYPGASAKDVEINVTAIIEDELQEVEGIKEIVSYSEDSSSRIEVQGLENLSAKGLQRLFTDLDNAISRVDDLPDGIKGKPVIHEVSTSDVPVLEISFRGDYKTLKPFLEDLKLQIRKISGVKNANIIGLPDEELHILVDSQKARRYNLDIRNIAGAIQNRNREGTGGTIRTEAGERTIVLEEKFERIDEVLQTELMSNDIGYSVKLKDIASLELVPEDVKLVVRNNGERGAVLSVQKIGSADLLDTVGSIRGLLESLQLPEGVSYQILMDQSTLTKDRLDLLIGNSIMGFVLVFIVLYFFLNFQTAFWTALGIPVSLLGMLVFLKAMDISLNLISLAGFIIIIGMLVDDAVVIAEEYNKNRESGMDPKTAAMEAVGRMWSPVFASTLTTIIAFAPLFMVGGFPGAFIWTIPLMVIVGLSFSLMESFVMLPVHLTHSRKMDHKENKWMNRIESVYKRSILFALKKRYFVLAGFVLLLLVSLITLRVVIKKDPFPQDAAESFRITLTYPLGYTEQQTEEAVQDMERLLSGIPEEDLLGYSVRIGTHSSSSYAERGNQNNLVTVFVYLTSYQSRSRTALEIMERVRSDLDSMNGNFDYVVNLNRIGPPMGRDIEIRILSNDDGLRKKKEKEILEYLSGITGVLETETDQVAGLQEIVVRLDHKKLGITGLTVDDVMVSMKMAIDGVIVTDISRGEERLDFRLKLQEGKIKNPEFNRQRLLEKQESVLPILNKSGYSINMPAMVSLSERDSEASIMRLDGIRTSTVFGNLNADVLPPTDLMQMIREKFPNETGFSIEFSGQPVETELIFSGLVSAGLVAILGVYLMIALIFNSYSRPAVVMFSLPFMAIGLAFVLLTHGIPGSMMVGIAIVGLMGVVVNASIVLIDTITKWNPDGSVDMVTIVEGCVSRLRPILLTATTTILGVLPTGYGIGGSDPFLAHMSLVLAYGLLFATAIILILVPVQLMIGIDIKKKWKKLF